MKFSQLFSEQWKACAESACSSLERHDLRRVLHDCTFDRVQAQFPKAESDQLQPVAFQEFVILSSRLNCLEKFVTFAMMEAEPKAEPSVFWGGVGLVVKVSHVLSTCKQTRSK
jgi:hypothetical protein